MNFVSNAIKFSNDNGTVRVEIIAKSVTKADQWGIKKRLSGQKELNKKTHKKMIRAIEDFERENRSSGIVNLQESLNDYNDYM